MAGIWKYRGAILALLAILAGPNATQKSLCFLCFSYWDIQYIRQGNRWKLQQLWKVEVAPSCVYLTHDSDGGLCLLYSSIADILLWGVILKIEMLVRWKKLFNKCIRQVWSVIVLPWKGKKRPIPAEGKSEDKFHFRNLVLSVRVVVSVMHLPIRHCNIQFSACLIQLHPDKPPAF